MSWSNLKLWAIFSVFSFLNSGFTSSRTSSCFKAPSTFTGIYHADSGLVLRAMPAMVAKSGSVPFVSVSKQIE